MNGMQKEKGGWLTLALCLSALAVVNAGAQAAQEMGTITNAQTGETMTGYSNADGTTTYVTKDANGKETSRVTRGKEKDSASSKDPKTGETVKSEKNADGSHTVKRTDKDGNTSTEWLPTNEPAFISDQDGDPKTGETKTITKNADGSHTVETTDRNGITRSAVHDHRKEPQGGAAVNPDNGLRTSVTDNGNGTRTIIITDQDGNVLHRETVKVRDPMSNDAYHIQNRPAVVYEHRPVVVERPVYVEERQPAFSIGLGFGFGGNRNNSCHSRQQSKCQK